MYTNLILIKTKYVYNIQYKLNILNEIILTVYVYKLGSVLFVYIFSVGNISVFQ